MSRTTITISKELVSELMDLFHSKNQSEAVTKAVTNAIRQEKKAQIKEMVGKVEFFEGVENFRHEDHRLG